MFDCIGQCHEYWHRVLAAKCASTVSVYMYIENDVHYKYTLLLLGDNSETLQVKYTEHQWSSNGLCNVQVVQYTRAWAVRRGFFKLKGVLGDHHRSCAEGPPQTLLHHC